MTRLKMAVFTPIPRANVTITTAANPGFLAKVRMTRLSAARLPRWAR